MLQGSPSSQGFTAAHSPSRAHSKPSAQVPHSLPQPSSPHSLSSQAGWQGSQAPQRFRQASAQA